MPEARATIIVGVKDEASANLKKVGDTSNKLTGDLKQGFGQAVESMTGFKLSTLTVAGAIGGLGAVLAYSVKQAAEAEKVMAQTEAVIKSTGGAAGLTADQIGDMAGAMARLNAVDDEVIQSGANLLLTFKAVKAEGFEPALQAALDMSIGMGIDLKQSVIQVGKALEDPIRGLTALRRSGVSFTAEQQKVIKALVETGQEAEAQKLILEELNKQFGGSGAAQAETFAGKLDLVKISADNLAQSLGEKLLPPLKAVIDNIQHGLDEMTQWEDAEIRLQAALDAGAISLNDYNAAIISIRYNTGPWQDALADINDLLFEATRATQASTDRWQGLADTFDNAVQPSTQNTVESFRSQNEAIQAAGGYIADYTDASEAVARILDDVAEGQERVNSRVQGLLDAGLSGEIQSALDDYNAALSESKTRVAELTAEYEKYSAMNGQVVTVTEEATRSQAEAKLAAIGQIEAYQRLQEANKELAENTDPDAQFELNKAALQAQVAFENASERAEEYGASLGTSETFVLNYNTKLGELKTALEEELVAQSLATQGLHEATAAFIFNQLVTKLDADAQLEAARALGLIDEESYNAAKAINDLTDKYDTNKDGIVDATEATRDFLTELGHVKTSIDEIPSTKDFWLNFHYTYDGMAPDQAISDAMNNTGGDQYNNYAHGTAPGGFIVPPGYPNDSYPINVSSGERVVVQTPAQQGAGGAMGNVNIESLVVNAGGVTDARGLSVALAAELRRALQSGMYAMGN